MKRLSKIALLSLASAVLFINCTNAKLKPSISSTATASNVEQLVQKHVSSRPYDFVPSQSLQSKLVKEFPNARDIEWEKSDYLLRADFEIGDFDYKAYYTPDENLVMVKAEIPEGELPSVVKNAALAKYNKYHIDEVEAIYIGEKTIYKVDLESEHSDVELYLNADGSTIENMIKL